MNDSQEIVMHTGWRSDQKRYVRSRAALLGAVLIAACGDDTVREPGLSDTDGLDGDSDSALEDSTSFATSNTAGGDTSSGATTDLDDGEPPSGTSSGGGSGSDIGAVCGDGVVEGDEECEDDSHLCDPIRCQWVCKGDIDCVTGGWSRRLGGLGVQRLRDLEPTPDGGYFVVVEFVGQIDFDGVAVPYTAGNSTEVGVVKVSNVGAIEWTFSFGGPGFQYVHDATVDTGGDLILAGHFNDELTLGPTHYEASFESYKGQAQYVVKISGQPGLDDRVLWSHKLATLELSDPVSVVSTDPEGDVVLNGFAEHSIAVDNGLPLFKDPDREFAYFVRFSSNGALLEDESFSISALAEPHDLPNNLYGRSQRLVHNNEGEMFWLGSTNYSLDLEGDPLLLPDDVARLGFLIKFDANGTVAWTRQLEFGHIYGLGVAVDSDGGAALAAAGITISGDIGCGLPFTPDGYSADIAIARFDSNGACMWRRNFPETPAYRSELRFHDDQLVFATTSIYVGGYPPQSLGGEELLTEPVPSAARADLLAGYDVANGEHLWSRAIHGQSADTVLRWGDYIRIIPHNNALLLAEDYKEDIDAQGLPPERAFATVTIDSDGALSGWRAHGAFTNVKNVQSLRAMSVDTQERALVAGELKGPLYLDDQLQHSFLDRYTPYVARFSADGQLDWLTVAQDARIRDVLTTPSGRIWVTGLHTPGAEFAGCTLPEIEEASTRYFVAELDEDGSCLGFAQFFEVNSDPLLGGIGSVSPRLFPQPDGDEGALLVGTIGHLDDDEYVQLGELQLAKNEIVTARVDPETHAFSEIARRPLPFRPRVITAGPAGDLVLLVDYYADSDTDWDGAPLPGWHGAYLVRLSPTLEKQWDFSLPVLGYTSVKGAATDDRVHLMMEYEYSPIELPGGVHEPGNDKRQLLIAFSADGEYLWSRDFGFDHTEALDLTPSGETLAAVSENLYVEYDEGWGFLRVSADGDTADFIASEVARETKSLYAFDAHHLRLGAQVRAPHTLSFKRAPLSLFNETVELTDFGGTLVAALNLP